MQEISNKILDKMKSGIVLKQVGKDLTNELIQAPMIVGMGG